MRKFSLVVLVAILALMTACSGSPNGRLATPSWFQGEWYDIEGDPFTVTVKKDNIMIYQNNQLLIDFKSNLALYDHVVIESQGFTDTSYQATLFNTSTRQYMYINATYTESSDTVVFEYRQPTQMLGILLGRR